MDKIKITQKEFDDMYSIEGITEETEVKGTTHDEPILDKQDTTPDFLTEEEQAHDDKLEQEWEEA